MESAGACRCLPREQLGVIAGLADCRQAQGVVEHLERFEHHVEACLRVRERERPRWGGLDLLCH